jgi:hypothetical protein
MVIATIVNTGCGDTADMALGATNYTRQPSKESCDHNRRVVSMATIVAVVVEDTLKEMTEPETGAGTEEEVEITTDTTTATALEPEVGLIAPLTAEGMTEAGAGAGTETETEAEITTGTAIAANAATTLEERTTARVAVEATFETTAQALIPLARQRFGGDTSENDPDLLASTKDAETTRRPRSPLGELDWRLVGSKVDNSDSVQQRSTFTWVVWIIIRILSAKNKRKDSMPMLSPEPTGFTMRTGARQDMPTAELQTW